MRSLATYSSILLALSLCSNTAVADDLCPGDIFSYSLEDQKYTFWITAIPSLEFRTDGSCDPLKECSYKVVASDVERDRIIVNDLRINKICRAFSRHEESWPNLDFEDGSDSMDAYDRINEVHFILKDDSVVFVVEVLNYYNSSESGALGTWDGSRISGIIRVLGASEISILTSVE